MGVEFLGVDACDVGDIPPLLPWCCGDVAGESLSPPVVDPCVLSWLCADLAKAGLKGEKWLGGVFCLIPGLRKSKVFHRRSASLAFLRCESGQCFSISLERAHK